jgi:hypothetical protein
LSGVIEAIFGSKAGLTLAAQQTKKVIRRDRAIARG